MRYLVSDTEFFERGHYRFVYDTKYKRFDIVQQRIYVGSQGTWTTLKKAPDNFYVYFPSWARKARETNTLPNWK